MKPIIALLIAAAIAGCSQVSVSTGMGGVQFRHAVSLEGEQSPGEAEEAATGQAEEQAEEQANEETASETDGQPFGGLTIGGGFGVGASTGF